MEGSIGYLSPSVFATPSDWDLILPKDLPSSLQESVQSRTEAEFDKPIEAFGVGLGI